MLKAEPKLAERGLTFCKEVPRASETEPDPSEWKAQIGKRLSDGPDVEARWGESERHVRTLEWQRREPGRSPAVGRPESPKPEPYTANCEA